MIFRHLATWTVSIGLGFVIAATVALYPLGPWLLASVLAAYAGLLWWHPAVFLFVLPVLLPAYDLGLWTGWMMVGESDLFVLLTLAVLLRRDPVAAIDCRIAGPGWQALAAFAACWLVAVLVGTGSPLGLHHSDNALLRPDNAVRLGKSLFEAIALLPFVRRRQRLHGDAVTLLGWGLAAGLGVVTLIVLAERSLFASVLDFSTAYRVAGPFSSMRVGGGHIGAYAALALPFSLSLFQLRPRWAGVTLALLACLCGGYTLAVTFARTAYAAAGIAMVVTGLGWLCATSRQRTRSMAPATITIGLILAGLAVAATFTGMHDRFVASATDFLTRRDNWRAGLAVRDRTVPATLFGMGLGSYQRTMLMRSPVNRPSDLILGRDENGMYVSMQVWTPFFLGQKIGLPDAGSLRLSLLARSVDGAALVGAAVCDKVLLYSDNCRGLETRLVEPNRWTAVKVTLAAAGLGGRAVFGLLRRPVELSLYGPIGQRIDIRDVALTDDAGLPLLANGDFRRGLDHWIFTDDSHVSWRMLNQYLMLLFETGLFGLAGYVAFCGLALAGALRSLRAGHLAGAAIGGAIVGFLVSGLFDNVLEAPRLATLFFLIGCCGLMSWDANADAAGSVVQ